jgi:hypothetical protein
VLYAQAYRYVFRKLGRKRHRFKVDGRYAKLKLEYLHELLLGDEPFCFQYLAKRSPFLLFFQAFVKLLVSYHPYVYEQRAKVSSFNSHIYTNL